MPNEPRNALLDWYARAGRDLPWRRTRDPYAIWVSEVMLQQTRVDTVIPYYERFLARFPTPYVLAEAGEDDVLALWSGLGYYRRARLLHAGVREVVARYGGAVPEDAESRRALPGIGRYTAGAIGSIAFDREEPIVDGNVARVLSRVHGIDAPLGTRESERALWECAEEWVRGPSPGDLNQALMELGATVCTPARPTCLVCPLAPSCVARAEGRVEALPAPKKRKAPKAVREIAVVATRDRGREIFLVKSRGALFGGLFGPVTFEHGVDVGEALRDAGLTARVEPSPIGRIVHVLSHRRLEVDVHRASGARAIAGGAGRFVRRDALGEIGLSSLARRLLEAAGALGGESGAK